MTNFTIHTTETAPDGAKKSLEASSSAFGFIPNLHAVLAESPQALEAYKALHGFFEKCSLSAQERNVVWLAVNVENACHYCVPAHTAIAAMQGVDPVTIEALREARPLPDQRLETLRRFTIQMVRQRGIVAPVDIEAFLAAGYTRQNIFDVLLGITQKTLSNYANHLAQTPVDDVFKKFLWTSQSPIATA